MPNRAATGMLAAAQIRFGGVDPVVQSNSHIDQPADYMQLFAPNAPWQQGASRTNVFKVSTQLINGGTDDQICTGWTACAGAT